MMNYRLFLNGLIFNTLQLTLLTLMSSVDNRSITIFISNFQKIKKFKFSLAILVSAYKLHANEFNQAI